MRPFAAKFASLSWFTFQGQALTGMRTKLEKADADLEKNRAKESQKEREIHQLETLGGRSPKCRLSSSGDLVWIYMIYIDLYYSILSILFYVCRCLFVPCATLCNSANTKGIDSTVVVLTCSMWMQKVVEYVNG